MILNDSRCYLAGPVEFSKATWRASITPKLHKLGINVYDPIDQPSWFKIDGHTQTRQRHLLNDCFGKHHPSECESVVLQNKYLRSICLRLVSACDFVICRIDGFTVGTFEEIKCAADQNKPVLFLTGREPIDSMWRLAQFVDNHMDIESTYFTTQDDLFKYLDKINSGLIENRIKWSNLLWSQK